MRVSPPIEKGVTRRYANKLLRINLVSINKLIRQKTLIVNSNDLITIESLLDYQKELNERRSLMVASK
jgi:hypothetical protein